MPDLSPLTRAQHIAELAGLRPHLADAGLDSELVEPDDPNELPRLLVDLGADDEQRPRILHVRIIPLDDPDDDEPHATRFVEMIVPIPIEVPDERTADLRQALSIVNEHLAIGLFGLRSGGSLYYRYVLATPYDDLIDGTMFNEVVAFVAFHQEHFADYLEGVCDDEIDLLVLDRVIQQSS